MSGRIDKTFGEILNLEAQLYDFEASLPKRVIADLLNADGSLRSTVELTHTSKGIFVETAETMPNIDTLLVKYYTYENDGTTLSTDHLVAEDKFMLVGIIAIAGELTGSLSNVEISENLSNLSLEGTIENNELLVGIVEEGEI